MKRRATRIFKLIAVIAAFCAFAGSLAVPTASQAKTAGIAGNPFLTRHVLSQPELTQLAGILQQYLWKVPVDFTGSVFVQGDAKPVDVPVGLGDYTTLPLLLEFWNVNPIPVVPGSTWAGVKLDYHVKPLGELTPAEQRNIMLRYRAPGWVSDRSTYTATSQLRYIPIMAWAGKSELLSLEDILATEFSEGRDTVKDRIEYIERLKNELPPDVSASTMREEAGITYTSWVTGRCFEPWHDEFSPGNGIIREITDPAEREKLHVAAMKVEKTKTNKHASGFLTAHPDSVAYYIAKLYGEEQTIWQAVVWTPRDYEEYAEPLAGETEWAIPIIVEKLKQNTMSDERYGQLSTLDWMLVDYSDSWCGTCQEAGKLDNERFTEIIPILQHGEFYERVKELGDTNMPLNDELVPYDKMTEDEKKTLGSDSSGRIGLSYELYSVVEADLPEVRGWEDLASTVMTSLFPDSDTPLAEQIENPLGGGYKNSWLSPITRRTIEPWHKEWSRGNCYLKRIEDEVTVRSLRELYMKYAKATMPWVPDSKEILKYQFYYIRLYGDKPGSIIAEGIWSIEKLN